MSEHTPLTEAERIEAVMVEHEYMLQNSHGSICRCGFVPTVDADSLATQQDYHRAHLAAVLAAGFVRPEDVEAQMRVAALLCERHQQASPTRQPCAACMQDAAATLRPVDAPEGGAQDVVLVQCPHRIGLAFRDDDGLALLPCFCNEPTEVLAVIAEAVVTHE